jgi:hypothetical protein
VVIIHSGGTEVFAYTGAVQQWTVPAGVTSVELHLVGAGGGAAVQGQGGSTGGTGGGGGYATGSQSVGAGDAFDIIVGQGGRHHCWAENVQTLTEEQRRNFSFGGGAAGYGFAAYDCSWASGGGRSAVRIAGGGDDIITAGGGGGGGGDNGGGGGSSFVGTLRGLQNGATVAGNRRIPGALPPAHTAAPTISGTACVGSLLTATSGSWTGATSTSFQWQSSTDGNVWSDIAGATTSTLSLTSGGFARVVERGRNLFGSTATNSASSATIDDNTLASLGISHGTLSPDFDSMVFSYSVTVPHSQSAIRITPTRSGPFSTLTINGVTVTSGVESDPIELVEGANLIEVLASNEGCSTNTTLTVTRQAPAPANLPDPAPVLIPETNLPSTTVVKPIALSELTPTISAAERAARGSMITIVLRGFVPGEPVQIMVGDDGEMYTVLADHNGAAVLTVRLSASEGEFILVQARAGERSVSQRIEMFDSTGTLAATGFGNLNAILIGALALVAGAALMVSRRNLADGHRLKSSSRVGDPA